MWPVFNWKIFIFLKNLGKFLFLKKMKIFYNKLIENKIFHLFLDKALNIL